MMGAIARPGTGSLAGLNTPPPSFLAAEVSALGLRATVGTVNKGDPGSVA